MLTVLQCAKDFPLRTSPFVDAPRMRSALWTEPRLRAEITCAEIVDGRLGRRRGADSLLDNLVRLHQHSLRERQPERLGRFQVDAQLEAVDALDG